MRPVPQIPVPGEVYSLEEVARAASIEPDQVRDELARLGLTVTGDYLPEDDAVRLTRILTGRSRITERDRAPMTIVREPDRRTGLPLLASSALHGGFVVILALLTTMGLLSANDTEEFIRDREPVKLVYLMTPGPGGGGGGGGLQMPEPPPPAAQEAPEPEPEPTPVPPVRRPPPPPRPQPRPEPPPPVPPRPTVLAPIVSRANAPMDRTGTVTLGRAPERPSSGPGTGGGVGQGRGTGNGEGTGSGLGPGTGGGTGGGPYQPGSGVTPPTLVREVRPDYTQDARRRGIEGDVVLQIVVRQDGTVGNVTIVRSLDPGLDQKAIEAVRRWQFGPARRQGQPVDVLVDVSVAFTLR